MADYISPKPIDPIWHQPDGRLHISCKCGRQMVESLQAFARRRGLNRNMKLYQLIARLRCEVCGGKPIAKVTRGR